jgi:hypothetical protein
VAVACGPAALEYVRKSNLVILCGLGGALLLACAGDPAANTGDPEGEGGATVPGSGGSGGGRGGSGGSAVAGGSGGASATGGASGSGGASATGGAAGGGSGGGSGGSIQPSPDAGAGGAPAADAAPVAAGGQPYGCAGCKRLFNGVDLTGWDTAPGAWEVKAGGVLASKGISADIYTHEDLGDYRIFFQVRHVGAMGGGDHKPCTVMFGKRPADPMKPARSLGGAQFQPPLGGSWDYGVGGKFTQPNPRPMFDDKKWHQCEVLVREAGSFHAACCPMGDAPCKTLDVLSWKGPGRKHPFDIMMHNPGLFDEYKEIWIELNPMGEALLSQK